jgi:two-component system, NtrC family, sensor histidine kinase AtoS
MAGVRFVLKASAEDRNNCVAVLVRDTGEGIAPDVLPRIFDPFFTTKPKGIGMGLAIAKAIIESHGGTLSVARNGDRGTIFEIRVPIANRDVF